MAISAALPRAGAHPWPMDTIPDPEVRERPTTERTAVLSPDCRRTPTGRVRTSQHRRSSARSPAMRSAIWRVCVTAPTPLAV